MEILNYIIDTADEQEIDKRKFAVKLYRDKEDFIEGRVIIKTEAYCGVQGFLDLLQEIILDIDTGETYAADILLINEEFSFPHEWDTVLNLRKERYCNDGIGFQINDVLVKYDSGWELLSNML